MARACPTTPLGGAASGLRPRRPRLPTADDEGALRSLLKLRLASRMRLTPKTRRLRLTPKTRRLRLTPKTRRLRSTPKTRRLREQAAEGPV